MRPALPVVVAAALLVARLAHADGMFTADGGMRAPDPEVCGNCVDDDGDGLVDAEDPDCCAVSLPLALAQPQARVLRHGARIALRLILPEEATAGTALQVQLGDGDQVASCSVVPESGWRGRGRTRQGRGSAVRATSRRTAGGRTIVKATVPGSPLLGDVPVLDVRAGDVCLQGRVSLRGVPPVYVQP